MKHYAMLGTQAAGAVHDFNNILFVMESHFLITSVLDDIYDRQSSDQQEILQQEFELIREACENIAETAAMGKTLVNGILTFARHAEKGQKLQQLAPIIEVPLHIYHSQIKNSQINLQTDFGIVPSIRFNTGEMQRIFLNLIVNSISIMNTHNSKKILRIRLWTEYKKVKVSIEDTGPGIPDGILPKIFNKNFTIRTNGKSSGMGLHTVKRIIRAHKGTIDVQSKIGEGTTFIISFPIAVDSINKTLTH